MELDLGPEMATFRQEIRTWIAESAPKGLARVADAYQPTIGAANLKVSERDDGLFAEWESRLAAASLICPQWPVEVGGRGWDSVRLAVFNDECHRAGLPRVTRGMGEGHVGPSILAHGTPEQKAHFLPRIINGQDRYCQGFSEPDWGSDLGSLQTRGVVDGEEIVLTGQKVWTTGAADSNMMFVLCRTDPDVPKHRGITYVLMPMTDNNIEVRPIRQISGALNFAEEFIDGARAPLFNVLGGLNNGWRVSMTTLGFERGGQATTMHAAFEREFWSLVKELRDQGRIENPRTRRHLAWAFSQIQIMRFSGMRLLAALAQGREPGPEASVFKLFWSEYHRRFGELALDMRGVSSLIRPDGEGYETDRWQDIFLASRADTIAAGTSEIQRNIIAERVLGLPRA